MIELYAKDFMPVVLGSGLKAAALVIAVSLALAACRRLSAKSRATVWFVAVIGCGALPVFTLLLPGMDIVVPVERGWMAGDDSPAASASVVAGTQAGAFDSVWTFVLAAYLSGIAYVLARFALQLKRVSELGRTGIAVDAGRGHECLRQVREQMHLCRRPELLHLTGIRSPLTWGVLRPRIAIPAESCGWSDDRLRNALTHEVAHIVRCDWLRLCVMRLVLAVQWFNPLVWFGVRRCEYETERACDEVVLSHGALRSEYARELIETLQASAGGVLAHAGPALGRCRFADRLRAVLRGGDGEVVLNRMQMGLLVAALLTLSAVLAACQVSTAVDRSLPNITIASAVADEIVAMTPDGVTLVELTDLDGSIRIVGQATEGAQIARFMRAIDGSSLGMPQLNSVRYERVGRVTDNYPAEFEMVIVPR